MRGGRGKRGRMETEILSAIDKKLEGVGKLTSSLDAYLAKMNEQAQAALAPPPPKTVDETVAEMEEKSGFLDKMMEVKVWHIPVGEAALGGFVAIFASELVDGFLKNQSVQVKGLVKLGAAGASVAFGKRILGSTGSKVVALLLTFDAIRDLTPLDKWAYDLAAKITGMLPSAGLAGSSAVNAAQMDAVNRQANQVAGYYSSVAARMG